MARIDLDPRTAEQLVAGRIAGADLPPGAEGVARVLSAARQAATESDLSAMDATVAAMVATATASENAGGMEGTGPAAPPPVRRIGPPSWVPKLLTVSVAGATAVFGALAAAGALPSSAQRPVAEIVSHVGIDLPRPSSEPKTPAQPEPTSTTAPSTTTTAPPGETTGTTAVTSESTVAAPPCAAPAVISASGCLEPQPATPTTTVPTPSTTQPPPSTSTTSTTVVQKDGGSARSDHRGISYPGLS